MRTVEEEEESSGSRRPFLERWVRRGTKRRRREIGKGGMGREQTRYPNGVCVGGEVLEVFYVFRLPRVPWYSCMDFGYSSYDCTTVQLYNCTRCLGGLYTVRAAPLQRRKSVARVDKTSNERALNHSIQRHL